MLGFRRLTRAFACSPATAALLAARRGCSHAASPTTAPPLVIDTPEALSKELNGLNDDFGEARMLIAEATESLGTNYYSDDAADATAHTEKTLARYAALKAAITDEDVRARIGRESDAKFRQLAEELKVLLEHDDD